MNLLFVCTHNRCRSILAEAIVQQRSNGLLNARSAGAAPSGEVHPLTLQYLARQGYATKQLRSKSWHDLGDFQPDVVITVCDSAANEACPLWLGSATKVHFGLTDPSVRPSDTAESERAFLNCMQHLERLCDHLLQLQQQPDVFQNPEILQQRLDHLITQNVHQ